MPSASTMTVRRQFASDNYSGICPEVWQALERANQGHAPAYGNDGWTEQAKRHIRDLFEMDCEVFFAFNGTAANALAMAGPLPVVPQHLCHEFAHVETDECGAPEFFSNGTKLLLVSGDAGRIEPPRSPKPSASGPTSTSPSLAC